MNLLYVEMDGQVTFYNAATFLLSVDLLHCVAHMSASHVAKGLLNFPGHTITENVEKPR